MFKQVTSKLLLLTMTACSPAIVFAATFAQLAEGVVNVLNRITVLLLGVSIVAFIIGVIRFIATAGDDQSRAQGKNLMIWGTVAIFSMVAVWGIVAIIKTTLFG